MQHLIYERAGRTCHKYTSRPRISKTLSDQALANTSWDPSSAQPVDELQVPSGQNQLGG
jgi:hypothetical protein